MNKKIVTKRDFNCTVVSLIHYLLGRSEVFVFGLAKATAAFLLLFHKEIQKLVNRN